MDAQKQQELADLHDHLGLHSLDESGRCTGCGLRYAGDKPVRFDPFPPLLELIPDAKYKVEFGSFSEADKVTLNILLGHNPLKDTPIAYELNVAIALNSGVPEEKLKRFIHFYDTVNRYLTAHPDLVPYGEKPLSDFPEVRRRLGVKMDTSGSIGCDAYTPKRLGWQRMGHTDGNITSGNKAVAYQHPDGRIAVYHGRKLTELRLWKQKCRQLTLLLIKLFGTKEILRQADGGFKRFVERYDATGVFEE